MNKIPYRTDLTDEQWKLLEPILPRPASRSRKRQVMNAILYLLHTGCRWRNPTRAFPARQPIYVYFRRFHHQGLLGQINYLLCHSVPQQERRKRHPRAANRLPEYMSFGDESGAIHYFVENVEAWLDTPGVLERFARSFRDAIHDLEKKGIK